MKLPSLGNISVKKPSRSIKSIVTGVLTAVLMTASASSAAMTIGANDTHQKADIQVERVITLAPDSNGLLSAYHSSHRSHSSHSSHSSHYSCTPGSTC